MDNSNFFKDLFESIQDYRKIVLLIFLFQIDENFIKEIGFSKNNINRLSIEFKNILLEELEEYRSYKKRRSIYYRENFE